MRLCKWELCEFPENEFRPRDGVLVHVAAGHPLHTAGGVLFSPGGLETDLFAEDELEVAGLEPEAGDQWET